MDSVDVLIQETIINRTKGWRVYDGEPYEPHTDNIGCLFLNYQREYGRCISKMYVDVSELAPDGAYRFLGKTKHIGWVFEKLVKYTDCDEKYLQETWVSFVELQEPARPAKYRGVDISGGD